MSLTLSQAASKVLRNVQIPEDGSAPALQALSDAKSYLNERAADVWQRRLWREFLILGTYTVPRGTQVIGLTSIVPDANFNISANGYNAVFSEIVAVRQGSMPIFAQDATAINMIQPDAWAAGTSPVQFVNRGQNGIFLLGSFTEDTALSFFGKANSQTIGDSETWILDNMLQALIEGASGDLIRDNDRDDNRASLRYQSYGAEIAKLIDAQEVQGANLKRIIPRNPWTLNPNMMLNISPTGNPYLTRGW